MVFEGGTVTPLGLLQELHSCLTLSRIMISMPEEVKVGLKNHACLAAPYACICCQKQLLVSESHHHQTLLEQLFLWEMSTICSASSE